MSAEKNHKGTGKELLVLVFVELTCLEGEAVLESLYIFIYLFSPTWL